MSISEYIARGYFRVVFICISTFSLVIYIHQLINIGNQGRGSFVAGLLLIILIYSTLIGWYEKEKSVNLIKNENKDFIFLVSLILFFIVISSSRYLVFTQVSPWLDEYAQAKTASRFLAPFAAAGEHQTPLDYLFSYWGRMLFGESVLALRFFSTTFNILACTGFYLLFFLVTRSNIMSFIAGICFAFQPFVYRYSIEGRPISLGLLCGLIILLKVFELIESKFIFSKKWLLSFSAIVLIFFLSLGLQTKFIGFALAVSILPLLISKYLRKKIIAIEVILFLGILLLLPFDYLVINNAMPRISKPLSQILSELPSNVNLSNITAYGAVGVPDQGFYLLYLLVLIFIIVGTVITKKSISKKNILLELYLILLPFIMWLVFPISFVAVFNSAIDYELYPRYLIFGVLLYWFSISLLFVFIKNEFHKMTFNKPLFSLLYILVISLIIYSMPNYRFGYPDRVAADNGRQDISGTYLYLLSESTEQDWIGCFSPIVPGGCENFESASEGFELPPGLKLRGQSVADGTESLDWVIQKLKLNEEPRHFYLVFSYVWNRSRFPVSLFDSIDGVDFQFKRGFVIAKIPNKEKKIRQVIGDLFMKLNEFAKVNSLEGRYQYLEVLLNIDIFYRRKEMAMTKLNEAESLIPDWRKSVVQRYKEEINKL